MNDKTSKRSDTEVRGPKVQLLWCDRSVHGIHDSRSGNGPYFPIHHGRARQNNNVWTGLFVQLSRRFS